MHGRKLSQMPQPQNLMAPRTFDLLFSCQPFSDRSVIRPVRFHAYKLPWLVPAHSVWLSWLYAIHVNTSIRCFFTELGVSSSPCNIGGCCIFGMGFVWPVSFISMGNRKLSLVSISQMRTLKSPVRMAKELPAHAMMPLLPGTRPLNCTRSNSDRVPVDSTLKWPTVMSSISVTIDSLRARKQKIASIVQLNGIMMHTALDATTLVWKRCFRLATPPYMCPIDLNNISIRLVCQHRNNDYPWRRHVTYFAQQYAVANWSMCPRRPRRRPPPLWPNCSAPLSPRWSPFAGMSHSISCHADRAWTLSRIGPDDHIAIQSECPTVNTQINSHISHSAKGQ